MKRKPLWKLSIALTLEAEEAVGEHVAVVFGRTGSTYTDAETGDTTLTLYCERRTDLSVAKLAQLRDGLRRIKGCGLDLGPGKISVSRVRHEDWAESWKRHFKPIEIGSALLIKPSWTKRRPRKGQAVVVLDPGLSFGTGQHPTTAFCLTQIVARRKPGTRQAFLDLGTGSGILAIAAAKLGYLPVRAFDFDPEAVRIARENARLNRVADKIRITRGDVTRQKLRSRKRYDIVCANLISTLLVAERDRIVNRVASGGTLVLAGILKREFAGVQCAYEQAGWFLIASRSEREWRSGAFQLRSVAALYRVAM